MVRMPPARRRHLVLIMDLALALGIAATFTVGLTWPLAATGGAEDRTAATVSAATQPARTSRPLGYYAVIWQKDLRRPLYDPPPVAVIRKKPAKSKLRIKLVGTVIEPGFSYAIVKTDSGQTRLVAVGQSAEGAEVVSVRDGTATIRFAGEVRQLTVEKDKHK